MDAEIISVGTELLLGQIVDTNSAEISQSLAELGVNVYFHTSVGDNAVRLAAVLAQAMVRSDIVIVTGGLGPTEDDMTKEALAGVSGRPLRLFPEALAHVEGYFRALGRTMTENNRRQAMLPEGAEMLDNPRGTAPGVYLQVGGVHVFCVPGVPTEMRTMWKESVAPRIARLLGTGSVIRSRTLRFYGIGESAMETEVLDLLSGSNPTLAPYAGLGEVRLRITAKAKSEEEVLELIRPMEEELQRRLGRYLYGYDDDTLESALGRNLKERSLKVAVAESCTGGLVAHRITNVPGSSAYFMQGWTLYSNEAKVRELGVKEETLKAHGAVSEQTARELALGALERSGADLAVGVTGVAGPDGGTPEKPVGLVWFGLAVRGKEVRAHSRLFRGNREDIKWKAASEALNALREAAVAGEM